jgi:hypothetical protein
MKKVLVVLAVAGVGTLACSKTESTPAATPGSDLQKISYPTTKLPSKGTKASTDKATKGGVGDTRPTSKSAKTTEASTDRQMRKAANVDKVDCSTLPDNSAECDGLSLYYCDDKQLWQVDCNAEAKFGGATSGSCYEGEKFIDCLGCGPADDGSTVCCDFQNTVCCAEDGSACYSPK